MDAPLTPEGLAALRRRAASFRSGLRNGCSTFIGRSYLGRRLAQRRKRRFSQDLRLLHDILARTPLRDRYLVWGGLLLGWAREGAPLAHDCTDADFAVLHKDHARLVAAGRALAAGGFKPLSRFVNNAGEITEYSFTRRRAKFEFFLFDRVAGSLSYHVYSPASAPDGPQQAVASIPDQPATTFSLLDRRWRKHLDHDAELSAIYGDWKSPAPNWWYMDDLAIHERVRWERADEVEWDGDG